MPCNVSFTSPGSNYFISPSLFPRFCETSLISPNVWLILLSNSMVSGSQQWQLTLPHMMSCKSRCDVYYSNHSHLKIDLVANNFNWINSFFQITKLYGSDRVFHVRGFASAVKYDPSCRFICVPVLHGGPHAEQGSPPEGVGFVVCVRCRTVLHRRCYRTNQHAEKQIYRYTTM